MWTAALIDDGGGSASLTSVIPTKGIAEVPDAIDELRRQILMHAANAKIIGVHPRSGRTLIKHHKLFAFFKAPKRRCQRSDVQGLRGDIEEV